MTNINLSRDERRAALERAETVAKKLHGQYYPLTLYNGSTKRLIGSHGKKAAVRPVRDVDMIFQIPASTFVKYSEYAGNGQSALLQAVRLILKERYPGTDIKGDGPVVVVSFATGHKVEVLPAYHASDGTYLVPRTDDGGYWAASDYTAEYKRLDDSDRATHGQTRRLIKMMKVWQSYCNVPIKSLCLELRAESFLSTWEHRGTGSTYDDWMVRDFYARLIEYANGSSKIPGIDEVCFYGDAWLSRTQTAYRNAADACGYESSSDNALATYMWTKIFGDQFDD